MALRVTHWRVLTVSVLARLVVVLVLLPGPAIAQLLVGSESDDPVGTFVCDFFDIPKDVDIGTARPVIAVRNDCADGAVGFDLVSEIDVGDMAFYRLENLTDSEGNAIAYDDPTRGSGSASQCPDFDIRVNYWNVSKPKPDAWLECDISLLIEGDGVVHYVSASIQALFIGSYVASYSAYGTVAELSGSVGSVSDIIPAQVARFMERRATTLLSSQPDLTGFLRGGRQDSRQLSFSNGTLDMEVALGQAGPVWADLSAAWSSGDGTGLSYVFGSVGAHARLGERAIVGAMVQLDHAAYDDLSAEIDGYGWLAGPYAVYRLPQAPVYLEGRLLYGGSNNDITVDGAGRQRFETERWLAGMKLSGEVQRGPTTWMPLVEVAYTEDRHDGFVDPLGNDVPAQSVALGEFALGLGFDHLLTLRDRLVGEVRWIGSHEAVDTGIDPLNSSGTFGRGRIELGWTHRAGPQSSLSLSGYWDGIGRSGYDLHGLSVLFVHSF